MILSMRVSGKTVKAIAKELEIGSSTLWKRRDLMKKRLVRFYERQNE
jgi:transposase-like protein